MRERQKIFNFSISKDIQSLSAGQTLGVENYFLILFHAAPHSLAVKENSLHLGEFSKAHQKWKKTQHFLILKESALLIRLPLNYSIYGFPIAVKQSIYIKDLRLEWLDD